MADIESRMNILEGEHNSLKIIVIGDATKEGLVEQVDELRKDMYGNALKKQPGIYEQVRDLVNLVNTLKAYVRLLNIILTGIGLIGIANIVALLKAIGLL